MMTGIRILMLALVTLAFAAGCNTMDGFGRDLEETGENLQDWSGSSGSRSY